MFSLYYYDDSDHAIILIDRMPPRINTRLLSGVGGGGGGGGVVFVSGAGEGAERITRLMLMLRSRALSIRGRIPGVSVMGGCRR